MRLYFVLATFIFATVHGTPLVFNCSSILPQNGNEIPDGNSPYRIKVSTTSVQISQTIKVKLTVARTDSTILGFVIKPRSLSTTSPTVIGTYSDISAVAKKACNDVLTNSTDKNLDSVAFFWTPTSTGSFVFEAVIFATEHNYYRNIVSKVIKVKGSPTTSNEVSVADPKSKTTVTLNMYKKCRALTKCLTDDDGTFILTWRESGSYVSFELVTNISDPWVASNPWIAIALAPEQAMANASVTMCKHFNGSVSVRQGYTSYEYDYIELPENVSKLMLRDVSVSLVHARMTCRFQRLINTKSISRTYSLSDNWYVEVSNGPIDADTGIPLEHTGLPFISDEKIALGKVVQTEKASDYGISPDPECGISKGCYSSCSSTTCKFQVTWVPKGQYVEFEIALAVSPFTENHWVALGFSYDQFMPNTSVVMCVNDILGYDVKVGFNQHHKFEFLKEIQTTGDLQGIFVSLEDFVLRCRFRRIVSPFYDVKQVFSLKRKYYLLLANGRVTNSGFEVIVNKHTSQPDVSTEEYDFLHVHNSSDITTPSHIQTTEAPGGDIVPDPECGIEKGCYADCEGDRCQFQVTWRPLGSYVEFEVAKNVSTGDSKWVAIGFSNDKLMPNTSVVMCMMSNGTPKVGLGSTIRHTFQFINNTAVALKNTSVSLTDSILRCSFQRIITSSNNVPTIFTLQRRYYLMVANGSVSVLNNTATPVKHVTAPDVSPEVFDFMNINGTGAITTPSSIQTTETPGGDIIPDPECGTEKGCYRDCETSRCTFQVTWRPLENYVEFEVAGNVSSGESKWIAIGFSYDNQMSNTSVVMCMMYNGTSRVGLGFNNGHRFQFLANDTDGLQNESVSLSDSILRCRFDRVITASKNTTLVYALKQKYYLLVARGPVMVSNGNVIPVKHPTEPAVSPEMCDFMNVNGTSPITTPSSIQTTETAGGDIIPDPECGVEKGCYAECEGGRCQFQVTWRPLENYVEFEVAGNVSTGDSKWVAIGFSNDKQMPNTSVVMCMMHNGTSRVGQGFNNGHRFQFLQNDTDGLQNESVSLSDSVLRCRFQRVISASKNITLVYALTQKYYLLVAHGPVEVSNGNVIPVKHPTEPTASSEMCDFMNVNGTSSITTPSSVQTTETPGGDIVPDPECGIEKGCYADCEGGRCRFQVTWRPLANYVEFEVAENVSTGDSKWVAIGFSNDKQMPNTSVVLCMMYNGTSRVGLGFNNGHRFQFLANDTDGLQNESISLSDSILRCSFQRVITASNNTTLVYALRQKYYLLVAQGPVAVSNGNVIPVKHTTVPSASSEMCDFINVNGTSPITTPSSIQTTETPGGEIVPDPECGIEKGCYADCEGGRCRFQVTWRPLEDYVEFEVAENVSTGDSKWVAIGFSNDKQMPNTSVVMCMMYNGTSRVGLGFNNGHRFQFLADDTDGLQNESVSLSDSILRCRFQRVISASKNTTMVYALKQKHYLLVAHGPVEVSNGNVIPVKHPTEPDASPEMYNFINVNGTSQITTPSSIQTTENPQGIISRDKECGKLKGCFSDCNAKDCTFQVTWRPSGKYIEFDVAEKVSPNDDNQWIAIGFSHDQIMSNTSVVMCMFGNGTSVVEDGFTLGHTFQPLENRTEALANAGTSLVDSIIQCKFQRAVNSSHHITAVYSLDNEYYLILAHGHVTENGTSLIPNGHQESPKVSDDMFNFLDVHTNSSTDITTAPSVHSSSTHSPSQDIVLDPECDKTKGCFYKCPGQTCDFLVTWQKMKNTIAFEVSSTVTSGQDNWIAVAFSNNQKMGNDSVVACVYNNGVVNVEMGYNTLDPTFQPLDNTTYGLSSTSGSLDGSTMRCKFQRMTTIPNNPKIFDLKRLWYLFVGNGKAMSGTVTKHTTFPAISEKQVNFTNTKSVSSKKYPTPLIKLHGFMMIFAWMLCSSLGTTIARFYKPVWNKTIFGAKLWFQLHRTLMITVFTCTSIAFIAIFVELGGYSKLTTYPEKSHPALGLVVTSLCVINPVMAFFRCAPDHKNRIFFNYIHWMVGASAHILAGVTIFISTYLEKANFPPAGRIVMIMYTVVGVTVYVVLEIHRIRSSSRDAETYRRSLVTTDSLDNFAEDEDLKKTHTFKKVILGIHVLFMSAFALTQGILLLTAVSQ